MTDRPRRNVIPSHPNVKPIGLGVDMIRSMATSHSDPIAAILELGKLFHFVKLFRLTFQVVDNVHDMHLQKKATSVS